ncbi:hypothetical protein BV392_18000 [Rhodovulum sulfidophilum]|nr:hypothetical protein BV392_18000 [Rhodovulum sulfidophilum]
MTALPGNSHEDFGKARHLSRTPGDRFAGSAHIGMPVTLPAELAKAGSVGTRATPVPFGPSGPIADQP